MRISNPFRYMMRESHPSDPSIYKAWFGKKYLIWKGKALHQSVNNIAKEIDQRMRLGLKEADVYTKVVNYIRQARITIFEVEVVLQSDNAYELLVKEHQLLKAGETDPDCLNTVFFPMLPGWVPQTAKDDFQQYLSKLTAAKKKQGKKKTPARRPVKAQAKKGARKSPANRSGKKASPFSKAKKRASR